MFTSPTILHSLISSGVRTGWEDDGDDPGLSRRMNVSSEDARQPVSGEAGRVDYMEKPDSGRGRGNWGRHGR
jgi:hypothetical protein